MTADDEAPLSLESPSDVGYRVQMTESSSDDTAVSNLKGGSVVALGERERARLGLLSAYGIQ